MEEGNHLFLSHKTPVAIGFARCQCGRRTGYQHHLSFCLPQRGTEHQFSCLCHGLPNSLRARINAQRPLSRPFVVSRLQNGNRNFPFTREEAGFPMKSDVQDKYCIISKRCGSLKWRCGRCVQSRDHDRNRCRCRIRCRSNHRSLQ